MKEKIFVPFTDVLGETALRVRRRRVVIAALAASTLGVIVIAGRDTGDD